MANLLCRIMGSIDLIASLLLFITRDVSPIPTLNVIIAFLLFLKGLMSLF
jgi:hypothetical protein